MDSQLLVHVGSPAFGMGVTVATAHYMRKIKRVYMSFWSKASIIGENIDKYT